MKRVCSKCKSAFEVTEFNWKIKGVRRSYHCKTCSRKYVKSHYMRNSKYYVNKARKRDLIVRRSYQKYIFTYLRHHHCIDCGESDILVLEFDHRDSNHKFTEISHIMKRGFPLNKLIKEISKCDVRCANCHRRKSAKEINSWRLKYAPVV